MLRVEMHDGDGTLTMRLFGRLSGEYADDIRKLLTSCNPETRLVVDLTDVTFVDAAGEEVLSFFGQQSGEFIAENVYAKSLCERLQLPVAHSRRRRREIKARPSGASTNPPAVTGKERP